ncbi:hypothetical protein BDZ89DRAFT_1135576 [Hymenopellis radicata]|nr:hypothetical protein BDZ89DRAFT_1135576 [Hymenopellis radicata]
MLVVHVSSTCDVCYDALSSSTGSAKAPYSIPCGHVFCRTCLFNIPPDRHSQHKSERRCPMCRASYTNNDIHKLQLEYSSNSNRAKRSELDEEMELVRAYIDHFVPENGQPRGNQKRWISLMEDFHERKAAGKSCSYFDRLLELGSGSTKVNMDVESRSPPHSIQGSIKAASDAGSNYSRYSDGHDVLSHNDSLHVHRERLAENAKQDYLIRKSDDHWDGASGSTIYNEPLDWGMSRGDPRVNVSRARLRFESPKRSEVTGISMRSWEQVHVSNASRTAYYGSEFQIYST